MPGYYFVMIISTIQILAFENRFKSLIAFDTQTWVPKRNPRMGTTLNLGRRSGVAWLVGFMVGIPVIVIVACVVIMELTK